jgi:hypothetical protein
MLCESAHSPSRLILCGFAHLGRAHSCDKRDEKQRVSLMANSDVSERIAESGDLITGADRERDKIRELGLALRKAGFIRLDHQANALGLPRSTTWKLLRADQKSSGLHARVITRMMTYKYLPPGVRGVLREYALEKARGYYGHDSRHRQRFVAHLPEMPELGTCEASCGATTTVGQRATSTAKT